MSKNENVLSFSTNLFRLKDDVDDDDNDTQATTKNRFDWKYCTIKCNNNVNITMMQFLFGFID